MAVAMARAAAAAPVMAPLADRLFWRLTVKTVFSLGASHITLYNLIYSKEKL